MDGLDGVRALLPGVRLDPRAVLVGSERCEVRRVHARWPDGGETTVIVKRYLMAGEGWAREAAALAVLPAELAAPRLVAEGAAPPVVVMSDVGAAPSVAEALLGDDPGVATDAVLDWARAMADLHGATLGLRSAFRAQLGLRAGDLPISEHVMSNVLSEAARLLDARCSELGITVPPGALRELRALTLTLSPDGAAALSPSDACPDDNVRTSSGVVLVDYEGAQWRHVAWDVAYLTAPWPSCWCSWRMPADVSERAVERYRAGIEDRLPYVRTPQFRSDVGAASVGWALVSAASLLPRALGADPPPEDRRKLTPSRRAMILHRLDAARRNTELAPLAELAGRLRDTLLGLWGEVPLAYAPAFANSA